MPKWITHEALAADLFNCKHHTATGVLQPWQKHLSNNNQLLSLLVSRMDLDWSSLAPKMRKAWTAKDVDTRMTIYVQFFFEVQPQELKLPNYQNCNCNSKSIQSQEALQRVCGIYLAAVEQYTSQVPQTWSQKTLPEIEKALLICDSKIKKHLCDFNFGSQCLSISTNIFL